MYNATDFICKLALYKAGLRWNYIVTSDAIKSACGILSNRVLCFISVACYFVCTDNGKNGCGSLCYSFNTGTNVVFFYPKLFLIGHMPHRATATLGIVLTKTFHPFGRSFNNTNKLCICKAFFHFKYHYFARLPPKCLRHENCHSVNSRNACTLGGVAFNFHRIHI